MCYNPYNNSRDRRIMKRDINQVKKDGPQIELGKQMQALTLKIQTLVRAQVLSLHFHSQHVIDVGLCMNQKNALLMMSQLQPWMRTILLVGNNSYNQYPNNFNQGQSFKQNQRMHRPQTMQNQRPRQEERQPSLQEIMFQYMAQNDQASTQQSIHKVMYVPPICSRILLIPCSNIHPRFQK